MNSVAQGRHLFFGHIGKVNGVVEMDCDFRGPEHPFACGVMLIRADKAYGHDGNVVLLRQAKCAKFEFAHAAVARAFPFGKNDEAHAAVNGVFCEAPHALEIRWATDVRHRNVAKALHQHAVNGNPEMGFEFPAARKLRDGAIKDEGVEKIYVVGNEEACALGIETRRSNCFHPGTCEKNNAAAKGPLKPVVLLWIEDKSQYNEYWNGNSGLIVLKTRSTFLTADAMLLVGKRRMVMFCLAHT